MTTGNDIPKFSSITINYICDINNIGYVSIPWGCNSPYDAISHHRDKLLKSIKKKFPKDEINMLLKILAAYLDNMDNSNKLIKIKNFDLQFQNILSFNLKINFSKKLSYNQIHELMTASEHHIKDIYINPTYKDDTRFHAKHELNFKYIYDSYNIPIS